MHDYTHAIVGKVTPKSVHGVRDDINYSEVRRQHDYFVRLLRELNVEVVELALEGTIIESCTLEDMAIVCHGIALLPKPKNDIKARNLNLMKEILKKNLGQTIIEENNPEANICGSDVLFTGREFFVGMTEFTNEAGANVIAEAFPDFPCTPIKVSKGSLNLKKYITVAGPDILSVCDCKEAKDMLKRMEREATFPYQTLTVPEGEGANCLFVNGTLIHRAIEEIPESFKVFCDKIDFSRRSIYFSELAKLGAGLSSCAVLVRKT